MKKKSVKKRGVTTSMVNQRIDDHEKLCRIMQRETNRRIEQVCLHLFTTYYFKGVLCNYQNILN